MSKNSGFPTAPMVPQEFQRGPPPPSYDECMKGNNTAGPAPSQPHQYTYATPTPYQQQQAFQPPPPLAQQTYGYANPYQTHIQQQQIFYNTATQPTTSNAVSTPGNVLYLAKGAKVRTTATGAISIPPPPPGCAATPAQLAAISGQPVMIKKQKKSFF